MEINRVGVDLAKDVFQLHGADRRGKTVWKRQLSRGKWLKVLCDTIEPGTEIGMEVCAGAYHWARQLIKKGYVVKIIPPQFVKPFIKSNKNDANDAAAICEAMSRPNMHPVRVKTVRQQDLQAMHRIRDEIKSHRVAKANQIRGLVTEYGLVAPQQLPALRRAIPHLSFLFCVVIYSRSKGHCPHSIFRSKDKVLRRSVEIATLSRHSGMKHQGLIAR